jgi:hypothetical protein
MKHHTGIKDSWRFVVEKLEWSRALGRARGRCDDNIKTDHRNRSVRIWRELSWLRVGQQKEMKYGEFVDQLSNYPTLKNSIPWFRLCNYLCF